MFSKKVLMNMLSIKKSKLEIVQYKIQKSIKKELNAEINTRLCCLSKGSQLSFYVKNISFNEIPSLIREGLLEDINFLTKLQEEINSILKSFETDAITIKFIHSDFKEWEMDSDKDYFFIEMNVSIKL